MSQDALVLDAHWKSTNVFHRYPKNRPIFRGPTPQKGDDRCNKWRINQSIFIALGSKLLSQLELS